MKKLIVKILGKKTTTRAIALLLCVSGQNLLAQTTMEVGTGIANITAPFIGGMIGMQGFADSKQTVLDIRQNLYSRAFIIKKGGKSVVLVITDLWAGTSHVKAAVVDKLKKEYGDTYDLDNVLISGTHNHSGMGGYTRNRLYEYAPGGFNPAIFELVTHGIFLSIDNAHRNLAPGKVYINQGKIADVGKQRSWGAYSNNNDRNQYSDSTDKEMTLLKFVEVRSDQEVPVGILNWYAIHPTDMGQSNRQINGDNKGWAAYLFESQMGTNYNARSTFVAGFANSNAGDVSGNVGSGLPDGGQKDISNMKKHGQKQFDKAWELFNSASEVLTGDIDYRHRYVDMSNTAIEGTSYRTWPAALGLSFAAGSSEDSVPDPDLGLVEGLPNSDLSDTEAIALELTRAALAVVFGIPEVTEDIIDAGMSGHGEKPIVLAPGAFSPAIVPQTVPLQLIKIGNLAIIAGPGEFNTMAGRRLRNTVANELGNGINHVVLAGYANEYTQYIATEEEYEKQHYEGASTLFGPYTLRAYQQEYKKLARDLKNGTPVSWDSYLPKSTAPTAPLVTITNNSNTDRGLHFYWEDDIFCAIPLHNAQTNDSDGEFGVKANRHYAFKLQKAAKIYSGLQVRLAHKEGSSGCNNTHMVETSDHITIDSSGNSISVGPYNYHYPESQDLGPYTPPVSKSFKATLQAVHSGKCLDVGGVSTADGANVHQWSCHGGPNQLMTFTPVPEKFDTYTIKFKHSGKCLTANNPYNGSNVNQINCHRIPTQEFQLQSLGDDIYKLVAYGGRVIDVGGSSTANGGNIIQWDYVGGDNQKWRLTIPTDDIVWRHNNGQVHYWNMNKGENTGGYDIYNPIGSEWSVRGVGDVNGDGTDDIVWQHNNGQVHYWAMGPNGRIGGYDIYDPIGSEWSFRGVGDVNGDGTDDIIWQHNNNGQVHYWPMSNGERTGGFNIHQPVGSDWSLKGVGDVNGDGTDDIVWQGANGQVGYWAISNSQYIGGFNIYIPIGSYWSLKGVGDVNGDGTDDLVWRGTNGEVEYWEMNNGQRTGSVSIHNSVSDSWTIVGVGDVGDVKPTDL